MQFLGYDATAINVDVWSLPHDSLVCLVSLVDDDDFRKDLATDNVVTNVGDWIVSQGSCQDDDGITTYGPFKTLESALNYGRTLGAERYVGALEEI